MSRLESIQALAATLPKREIRNERGELYITRYRLHGWMPETPEPSPVSVYLHNIHLPDSDEAPHNHPWEWTQSTILHGGYKETRGVPGDRLLTIPDFATGLYRPGDGYIMGPDEVHRITHVQPDTWTIFAVGPKRASWGFLVEGRGMVPWRERFAERGVAASYPPSVKP